MSVKRLLAAVPLVLLISVARAQGNADPPQLVVNVTEGETANLTCQFGPSVIANVSEVEWHIQGDAHNAVPCNGSAPRDRFACEWRAAEGRATLTIERVALHDAGRYACGATRDGGDRANISVTALVVATAANAASAGQGDRAAAANQTTSSPPPSGEPGPSGGASRAAETRATATPVATSSGTRAATPSGRGVQASSSTAAAARPTGPTDLPRGAVIGVYIALLCLGVFATVAIYFVAVKVLSKCMGRSRSMRLSNPV